MTTLLLFCFTVGVYGQIATVQGRIVDNNNTPLAGVNVYVKESQKGTQTDFDGNFKIENVSGTKILVISYIGYKTREINVTAPVNLSDIILYEGNELLQAVTLDSRKNKFSRKKTAYVSKLPLKDIENSQVYTTITSDLLESQVVTDLDEAMVNATGIYKLWEATGRSPGEGTAYFSTRGFSVQPRLIDGVAGVTFSAIDPSYVERIEVIKGPTATLFGSTETSLGGLINIVTKKPYEGTGGSVSYTGGSFGFNRITADYNTGLGDGNDTFFRVNASYLTEDSFQDAGFRDTFFVAPSLSFRVNNRLNISAGIEVSNTRQTNPSMLFLRRGLPLISTTVEELNVDPNRSFTSNDIYLDNLTFNARAVADYKISDNWTSQTIFSSSYAEIDGYYQFQFDGGSAGILQLQQIYAIPELQPILPAIQPIIDPLILPMLGEAQALLQQDSFTRVFSQNDGNETRINLQQNFIGDFKIGKVRNRVVLGLDYINNQRKERNKNGNPVLTSSSNFPQLLGFFNNTPGLEPVASFIESSFAGFPYFDAFLSANGDVIPSTFTPNATYSPNRAELDAIFAELDPIRNDLKSQTLAAYASDVINITPELTVNVGLRLDHFIQDGNEAVAEDDFTKTTFSPNAGILYQPLKNKLSVFANYQTGFVNVNPIVNPDGTVDVFEPQRARQFEGGVKTNFFKGKVNFGLSYYHITVDDFTTSDPTIPLFARTIDIAEVVSKGVEFELNASPIDGLNLRASYSFNDMEYTDVFSSKAVDAATGQVGRNVTEFAGRRPESAGPESLYNFWADYRFPEESFAKNFGVGLGFNGASENLTVNNAVTGTFTLPSYTIYNASVYYDANRFRIGLKVNNFTDEVYYNGWTTVNAQPSRAFLGTISYKF
ncbi:MAG: TonB-dependent receptor [Bacteroidota bacterium]